jgi:hypothetical protein
MIFWTDQKHMLSRSSLGFFLAFLLVIIAVCCPARAEVKNLTALKASGFRR